MKKNFRVFTFLLLVTVVVLAACGGSGSSEKEEIDLTLFVFAAPGHKDVPREVVENYMKDNPHVNIQIIESSNADTYPKMVAARQATPDDPYIDIAFLNEKTFNSGIVDDMWEPLNADNIPNLKNIPDQFIAEDNKGIAYAFGAWGLIYNEDNVTEPPTSYADLWSNPVYKGKVALWDYQFEMLAIAAKLNGGSESDIDPGFEVWSENIDQIHSFFTSNEQLKNLLTSGEADITYFDFQQTKVWQDEGANIGISIPEEGVISVPLYVSATKGIPSKKKEIAEELINLFIEEEAISQYAEQTFYVPTNLNAPIPDSLKDLPAFDTEVIENAIMLDTLKMAEFNDEWSNRWDREIKSKLQ